MKYYICLYFLLIQVLGANSLGEWFGKGDVFGNIKYYYIETNKFYITPLQTSAHSNALGGELHYNTPRLYNFKLNTAFMTTKGFLLSDSVESSTLGQDDIKRGLHNTSSYALLGIANLDYQNKYFQVWYGRKEINTPMIGPKRARMLPSLVEGGGGSVALNEKLDFSLIYADKFKQRSSKEYINIVAHALGSDTKAIIGKDTGKTYTVSLAYQQAEYQVNLHNMYAPDFVNVFYMDAQYLFGGHKLSAQIVEQRSVGNADKNLADTNSVTKGKKIRSKAFGLRGEFKYKQSSFDVVYRNIFRDAKAYDSILTPWDGSLLYAYSSTTNNLGQSLYGNGLTAGGAYVGGTQGLKLGYTQKYDFLKLKGIKTHIAYAVYKNDLYRENQEDLKLIFFYNTEKFSLQLKGIWIDNDTYTFKDGTVNQLDSLTQFHVIANYKF